MLNGQQAGAVDGGWNKDAGCGSGQDSELIGSAMSSPNSLQYTAYTRPFNSGEAM